MLVKIERNLTITKFAMPLRMFNCNYVVLFFKWIGLPAADL
ncbi:hypothetical protein SAMN04488057_11157 [Cyclobacterium lianum]|uniref:Uncharacterized protein n=1 Tax=Cyclobacterium lianum TaxID=388280 RepID=A0A1M7PW78_9BACT|nr:hypothetical protein SAMN04488057_11157 [Cyclobacterium lianum]